MHGKPVRALIFDMDNTPCDLVGATHTACRPITGAQGGGFPDTLLPYLLRRGRDSTDPRNISDFLVDTGVCADDAIARGRDVYRDVNPSHSEPCHGIQETLPGLDSPGYPVAPVTDTHHRDAMPRPEKVGPAGFFGEIVTFDMTWEKKPGQLPFLCALRRFGLVPELDRRVTGTGDGPSRDIAPAVMHGMQTVYARYCDCFSSRRDEGRARFFIDSTGELLPLQHRLPECSERRDRSCAAGSPSP